MGAEEPSGQKTGRLFFPYSIIRISASDIGLSGRQSQASGSYREYIGQCPEDQIRNVGGKDQRHEKVEQGKVGAEQQTAQNKRFPDPAVFVYAAVQPCHNAGGGHAGQQTPQQRFRRLIRERRINARGGIQEQPAGQEAGGDGQYGDKRIFSGTGLWHLLSGDTEQKAEEQSHDKQRQTVCNGIGDPVQGRYMGKWFQEIYDPDDAAGKSVLDPLGEAAASHPAADEQEQRGDACICENP